MAHGLEKVLERLRGFDPSPLVPAAPRDAALDGLIAALDAPPAARSALHLWNDSLVRCHDLAQEIHDPTGSYLHGVMHRREPDYPNAKYWFRKVGTHPLFPDVLRAAGAVEALRTSAWDPFKMVDLCEEAAGDPALEKALREVQAREIERLAAFCLRA
ncbi:MAG TPA: hypothetical protein VF950_27405 [Planctomycetota bacterium]